LSNKIKYFINFIMNKHNKNINNYK
jgi:hypothetical protein